MEYKKTILISLGIMALILFSGCVENEITCEDKGKIEDMRDYEYFGGSKCNIKTDQGIYRVIDNLCQEVIINATLNKCGYSWEQTLS